uniref:Inositol-pentakisphosphate 2-kinase n=1 Tax=Phlebotomus kandelakii TaxID=1109342 RepID=A0A6B2EA39_9DIPT
MGRSKRRAKRKTSAVILTIVSKSDGTIVNVDRERLVYRAEGNANLVLAIPDLRQVLRLRKSQPNADQRSTSIEQVIMVTEYGRIMSSLFSEAFTIEPRLVLLRIPNYNALNKWLSQFRPSARCDKEIRCRAGILYPDLAVLRCDLPSDVQVKGETYCVEIKPKQGWIFSESTLKALYPDSKAKLCRFCAMQYLKLVKKTIKRVSNYCPIDLFSGDRDRMLKALRGLVETPQNNFRMWRSGQLIYGDAMDSAGFREALEDTMCQGDFSKNLHNFLQLLLEAIIMDYTGENVPTGSHSLLPPGSILKQILDVQLFARDNLSITDESLDEEQSFGNVEKILTMRRQNESEDWLSLLDGVAKYFLGATALDCSLMMTFQKVTARDKQRQTICVAGEEFIVSMTVMDLDPKADSHPIKYVKQTRMSYKAHRDFVVNSTES